MDYIIGLITGFVIGAWVAGIVIAKMRKDDYPYSWACPREDTGCSFTVKGNDPVLVDAWATRHERAHARGSEDSA